MSHVETAPAPDRTLEFSEPLDSVNAVVLDNVARITFSRPPVNAVDIRAMREIHIAFSEVGDDDEVRAVVFTSSGGKAFCAGADLKAFAGEQDVDLAHRMAEKARRALMPSSIR